MTSNIGSDFPLRDFKKACGPGSYPQYNDLYCKQLILTLEELNPKKVVDYGCGNLETYKGHINWTKLPYTYIGYELDPVGVRKVRHLYPELTFQEAKLKELPEPSDVLIIKDVLIHWFDEDIRWFFENVFDTHTHVIYMHSTTDQGYDPISHKRTKYDEHYYGQKSVPQALIPWDRVTFKTNIKSFEQSGQIRTTRTYLVLS